MEKIILSFVLCFFVNFCLADMRILKINKSHYIDAANSERGDATLCSKWTLNARQIEKIFLLSDKYKENGDIMNGYWLWFPCYISGELIYNNEKWHFSINAAATSEWSAGNKTIYWGCSKKECDDMFIVPYPKKNYIDGGGKLIW